MTITFRGTCPECGGIAAYTQHTKGTGNAPPEIECACQERLAHPSDMNRSQSC